MQMELVMLRSKQEVLICGLCVTIVFVSQQASEIAMSLKLLWALFWAESVTDKWLFVRMKNVVIEHQ
jgi:hypothetical protein